MSEMESKAALWHKKKEFRAIWGNPGSLQPLGRNNMSQLLLYTLSRVLANCPQLYCPASVLILAKKEVVELQEKSMRRMLSALQPVQPVLREGGIGKGLFLSKSPEHLSRSSTQTEALKTSRRLYSNYLRSQPKIFRTNLMLEHDSRGIQFPGRDPARTCG